MSNKSDEIRAAKSEYYRDWRRKNPERAAKIQERFWSRKVAEMQNRKQAAGDPGQQETGSDE